MFPMYTVTVPHFSMEAVFKMYPICILCDVRCLIQYLIMYLYCILYT